MQSLRARWRAWRARKANDKTGKVTSGRMTESERSAEFHRRPLRTYKRL